MLEMDFWTVLFLTALLLASCRSYTEFIFHKEDICHVQERIDHGCSKLGHQRFPICLAECRLQSSCTGVSVDKTTGKCFLHDVCSSIPECVAPDTHHRYYAKYCKHGQLWNSDTRSCDCQYGLWGKRCEKAFQRCDELLSAGYSPGSYTVYLDPKHDGILYKINCYILATGWNAAFVVRNYGGNNILFNRTWNEYVNGFNLDDENNYWVGLNVWHALSTYSGCEIMFVLLKFADLSHIYRWHFDFVVGDITDNYSFSFSSSSQNNDGGTTMSGYQTAGDCMSGVQNIPFSTWDRDNDGNDAVNCPSLVGNGWWHPRQCDNPCNFLGWGLEDWDNMPSHQRFSMLGVNMDVAKSQILGFDIYLEC